MVDGNLSSQERFGAACLHLGYVPVGLALIAALAIPAAAPGLLIFSLLWTVGAWFAANKEPASPFLRSHLQQARGYHRRGVTAAVCFIALTIYFSFFTWGVAAGIALIACPIMLVMWMLPTWRASYAAMQGEPYHYEALDLTRKKVVGSSNVLLTQCEAEAIKDRVSNQVGTQRQIVPGRPLVATVPR